MRLSPKIKNTLFVSDLDGTLLRGDGTVSAAAKTLLNEMLSNGIHFTVASARSVVSMQPILEGIGFRLPIIELNGALITDIDTGKHQVINSMQLETVMEVWTHCAKQSCLPIICSFDGEQDRLYYDRARNPGAEGYLQNRLRAKDRRLRQVEDLQDSFRDQIISFMLIDEFSVLKKIEEDIYAQFADKVETHLFEDLYMPGWSWLTIHDSKATKARAISRLAEDHQFDLENLVVFGDQTNDICMFKIAGKAIAMGNAAEELKQYATMVIGTNDEESVLKYISQEMISEGVPCRSFQS